MKLERYYSSIDDMPLYNWIKCTKGELKYVLVDVNSDHQEDELQDAWTIVYDQYLREFGLTPLYRKLLNLIKEKTILECDYVITQDRSKLTEIEIRYERLKNMTDNNGSGVTIEQTLIHLSKWMNVWISSKSIVVREYFNLVEEYGKANKK